MASIALLLLLLGCGERSETKGAPKTGQDASTTQPPKPLVVATFSKAIGNSPFHIAKHFGWFSEESSLKGRTINFKEFNDRAAISDAFSAGQLDVLFSAEVPSLLCRIQGNDIRIVNVSTKVQQSILVPPNSDIKGPAGLRGKTVVVLQGTSSHYCLLKILADNGIAEKDLSLRYMPVNEARVVFENRSIDAWAVWAPFVEQQEIADRGVALPGGDAYINSVMTMAQPLILQDLATARALVQTIERSKAWMRENPDKAIEIVASELGLYTAVVKQAWPKHDWSASLSPAAIVDFQKKADFLAEQDKTRQSKSVDVAKDASNTTLLR